MKKQIFNITINTPRERVWDVLFGEETYPQWTSAFAEESSVKTDWQEGSKTLFFDGKGDGMVSMIEKVIPNEYMSIRHIGELRKGVEDLDSESVKKWAGCHENYILKSSGSNTELVIEMDMIEGFEDYFLETWPKALEKVKDLSEKREVSV
jgi:uncharacterized protein YndB with AHSA1/START domain